MKALKYIVKFTIVMVTMTILCTWAWDASLNGKVYFCTDGGAWDYWFPGDWVHAHDGQPIEVVSKIIPTSNMNAADMIQQGWSVTKLWFVWYSSLGVSIIVSVLLAWMQWLPIENERNKSPQATAPACAL